MHLVLLLSCSSTSSKAPEQDPGGSDWESCDGGSTTAPTPGADLLFDGRSPPEPLIGLGAQIWAGDEAWPAALDPLGARIVRIALNANYGSSAVELPVDASPEEWDAWFEAHALDASPTFLADLQHSLALSEERELAWIAHQWEAPPVWEEDWGQLKPEHVDDFAAMTGALMGWLADQGIEPRWIELCNEPDGDWNSYIAPEDYDALVRATRADLDARELYGTGLLGPGLATLGGWVGSPAPEWIPSLSEEAVTALEGWSAHTWDDYGEDGEGHLFLQERWQIFIDQLSARDPGKPIFATELGSKDLRFGEASYSSTDGDVCGFSTESEGYALRMLAHLAVALDAGADAILVWEAADQAWQCSRWGMIDGEGRSRPFHQALALFTSALPADGGTVRAPGAELPAIVVVVASQGAVLLVNDSSERTRLTVAVEGGWSLVEARGFRTEEHLLYDELIDLEQTESSDPILGLDTENSSYFEDDASRVTRTGSIDAALVWSVAGRGELVSASLVGWSWNGADPASLVLESSLDGTSWEPQAPEETLSMPGWHRHDLVLDSFPEGTTQLRVTLPAVDGPFWSPQLGEVALRWRLAEPASLPSGEAPWTVDLPAESALVLVVER